MIPLNPNVLHTYTAIHAAASITIPADKNMNNDREIIVDKLNGALALYRRERDDYARKKELSEERLRMKKEERVELEKVVRFAEEKLNELLQAAKTTSCTEIAFSLGMPAGGSNGNDTHRKTTKSLDALDAEVEQVRKEVSVSFEIIHLK